MRRLLIFATTLLAAGAFASAPASATSTGDVGVLAGPSASQLLAKTRTCNQISNGKFRTDEETGRTVPVCDANGAVWWRADMDIDCDGQRTSNCNEDTDCCFQPDTAFHQSDGKPLRADTLHYIVVPSPSSTWRYTSSGLRGAGSCAVIFNNKVLYAVIGDTGPTAIIGEASFATARIWGSTPTRPTPAPTVRSPTSASRTRAFPRSRATARPRRSARAWRTPSYRTTSS